MTRELADPVCFWVTNLHLHAVQCTGFITASIVELQVCLLARAAGTMAPDDRGE